MRDPIFDKIKAACTLAWQAEVPVTFTWQEAVAILDALTVDGDVAAEAMAKEIFEQLTIATDMADKRWRALNEIYEQASSRNVDWCRRKAREGLGL